MTEVLSTRSLLTHPEFQALLGFWERDRRAPICLGDWLREQGLELQGAVAEWCALYKDRPTFAPTGKEPKESGVFPCWDSSSPEWYWGCYGGLDRTHHLPDYLLPYLHREGGSNSATHSWVDFYSPSSALVALLDGWAEALRDGHTLPPL